MVELKRGLVRRLAAGRAATPSHVSCFVDLDPSTVPTASELASHVTSLRDRLHAAGRDADPAARRIASHLENELERSGAHGLALYASDEDDLVEVRLPGPVAEGVHVGRTYVVGPLLELLELDRTVLLAAVGRDRGTIWQLNESGIDELRDLSRNGQGRHDQGGWSQANYQRSREEEAREHLEAVADELAAVVPEGSDAVVAVACTQEIRSSFEDMLAPHLVDALVGYVETQKQEDAYDLLPAVEELLRARLRGERAELLERWRGERGQESGRAAAGWAETMTAAWDGQVDTLVVDGRTQDAFECPECSRGYLDAGTCELDGTALEDALGGSLEVAVRGTLVHDGEVRVAGDGELDGSDGAVALLRYAVAADARTR
jgi:peptide chain release factor subunit 1